MAEESLKYKTKVAFFWNLISQGANFGMNFIVGIVMARLLSPSDYGITALPAIFIAVASTFIGGGFGLALIRKPDLTEKDLSTAFYYSMGMGLLMYLIIFVSAPWIASFYNAPILVSLIRITALTFLIGPINTPQTVILNKRIDFKTPARISIVTRIISGCVGISIAYMGYGVWSLVVSNLLAGIISAIFTWLAVKWFPKERFSKESFRYLWNYGNKMMASSLINTIYGNITPTIVGKFFGTAELGLYNRANGYASLLHSEIAVNVQTVSYPVLSKLLGDDKVLANAYNRIIKNVCFVYFPIMVLLIALARPIIVLMLTDKWADCVPMLQILSLVAMSGPLSVMNTNVLQVKGRPDLYLKLDVKKKIVALFFMLVTLPFGLIPYCWGTLGAQMYVVYVNLVSVGKIIPLGFARQIKELFPMMLLSLFMLVSIFIFNSIFDNLWVQLLGGGCIGVIVYVSGAFLCKFPEIDEVKYMISKRK